MCCCSLTGSRQDALLFDRSLADAACLDCHDRSKGTHCLQGSIRMASLSSLNSLEVHWLLLGFFSSAQRNDLPSHLICLRHQGSPAWLACSSTAASVDAAYLDLHGAVGLQCTSNHGGLLQGEDNTTGWSSVAVKHKKPSTVAATGARYGLAWQPDETPKAYQVQCCSHCSNHLTATDAGQVASQSACLHALLCMQHLR